MVIPPSPTADLNKVSNLAWSCAVIKDSRMLGILLGCGFSGLRPRGFAVPPVWKDAAISVKPGIQCIVAGEAAAAAVPGLALESQYTVAAKELVRSLWVEAQRDWVVDQAAGQHPYYQTILRHTAAAAAGHQVVGCYRLDLVWVSRRR
ncbi:hypothetical protein HG531_011767 [Fusarium graminearum]|nr:hypothetical protein HG531_011767 [Fusarium graminearum]